MAPIASAPTVTAGCVWLTGPAGSGKRTVAQGAAEVLERRGIEVVLLDERTAHEHLAPGVESLVWLCRLLVTHGVPVIACVPLATRAERDRVREEVPGFVEVLVDRGHHDAEYEAPFAPDLRIPTHDRRPAASIAQLVSWLEDAGYVTGDQPAA